MQPHVRTLTQLTVKFLALQRVNAQADRKKEKERLQYSTQHEVHSDFDLGFCFLLVVFRAMPSKRESVREVRSLFCTS